MGLPEPSNTRPSMSRDTGVLRTCAQAGRSGGRDAAWVTGRVGSPGRGRFRSPLGGPPFPPTFPHRACAARNACAIPTHVSRELQRGAAVVDARGSLEHLHHGAVAVHLQHLPAPSAAIAQPDVDDLCILGLLQGRRRGGVGTAVPHGSCRACGDPPKRGVGLQAQALSPIPPHPTLTRFTTTSGPATPPTVRYSAGHESSGGRTRVVTAPSQGLAGRALAHPKPQGYGVSHPPRRMQLNTPRQQIAYPGVARKCSHA